MCKLLLICVLSNFSVCVSLGDEVTNVKDEATNRNVKVTNTNSFGDVIITVKGVTYNNVKITGSDGLGVKVQHKAGVAYIPYNEMTSSDQTKWGYDPVKTEAFLAEKQTQKEKEDKSKNTDYLSGVVIAVATDGIICKGWIITKAVREKQQKESDRIDKLEFDIKSGKTKLDTFGVVCLNAAKSKRNVVTPEQGTYFIAGVKESLADKDRWKGYVYYAGIYKYIDILGAMRTIRAYATNPELAQKMLDSKKD